MTLEELKIRFSLSDELVEFCRQAGFVDLDHIKAHEAIHGTFLSLPRCTVLIETALIELLSSAGSGSVPPPTGLPVPQVNDGEVDATAEQTIDHDQASFQGEQVDFTLGELKTYFGLSIRAFNVLDNAGLERLSDIRVFALKHGGFQKLRNCGRKTVMEIEDLLKRFEEGPVNGVVPSLLGPHKLIRSTSDVFAENFSLLGTRTQNQLVYHAGSDKDDAMIEFLLANGPELPKLPGCGTVVLLELRTLQRCLLEVATAARLARDRPPITPLSSEQRWILRHDIASELEQVLWNEHGVLRLLAFLVPYLAQKSSTSNAVYLTYMSQIEVVSTLEAIAETHAITRERVRQIVQRGRERFSKLLEPLKDLPGVHAAYPTLIAVDGWLLFTNDLIKPLNEQEGTQWPPLVFAYLSLVLSEGRCAQVTWSTVLGRSQRSKALDIQYPMIVSLDLLPTFNVCMEQVRGMVQGKRQEDTRFPLETLTAAWGAHSDGSLTRLLTTVLPLAFEGVSIDDAVVVLHANHKWRQDEQLEAVLIELDEPSHVTHIHQKWCERFPDQPVTIDGVRAVAVRHAERFFSIGRTSTYGLRRWEEERPHLKGGTIRDLVEDLLEHSTVPIHVEDLIEHIQKYRPTTNLVSVKQNLQLETNGRFTFYPGGFVGLGGRIYEQVPAPPARVPGSMMRTHVLERYIGSHLNELTNYIAAHSQADSKRIVRVIDKAIAADRIVLDSDQVIIRINPVEFEPDELPESDELPFSW